MLWEPNFSDITLFSFSKEAVKPVMENGFGYKFPQANRVKIWKIEEQELDFYPPWSGHVPTPLILK